MADTLPTTVDIAHLRTWIGREERISDEVSADLARKLHATLGVAGAPPGPGEAAPRLVHFCLGQPAAPAAALGPDGHPARGGFLPPVPLPRRMWAGGRVAFHGDLKVGDVATRTSRIADVTLKDGSTGPLCFVTVEHRVYVGGRPVLEEWQDIVYRGAAAAPARAAVPAPRGEHHAALDTSPTTLFRYSALTFNGHRIHYDRRYAIEREGYAGLVVHGPLQATQLLHFAARLKGRQPDTFSFRSQSPLFDDDRCALHAEDGDGGMKLWTARDGGPVAMMAKAGWS
jgi:3-methylfumaryl-CoA hydratase